MYSSTDSPNHRPSFRSRVLHRLDMVGPGHQPEKLSSLSPWSSPITGCNMLQSCHELWWSKSMLTVAKIVFSRRASKHTLSGNGRFLHSNFSVSDSFAVFWSADGCSSPGQEIPRWRAPKWSWPWKCDLATTGSLDFLQVKKRAQVSWTCTVS